MEKEHHKVFTAKCREIMRLRGCRLEDAADEVRQKHPTLHRAYMNELISDSGETYKKNI